MQYWPPALDKKELYGDIYIGIDKEEQLANFHIRTFRIWKQNEDVSIFTSHKKTTFPLFIYNFGKLCFVVFLC